MTKKAKHITKKNYKKKKQHNKKKNKTSFRCRGRPDWMISPKIVKLFNLQQKSLTPNKVKQKALLQTT